MSIEDGDQQLRFSRRDTKRIGRAIKHFEGSYRTPPPGPARGMRGGPVWVSFAVASGSISAGSGSGIYGSGTISLCLDGGSSLSVDSTQIGLTVKNLTNKTIANGTFMIVGWIGGTWWVLVPDLCSNLS